MQFEWDPAKAKKAIADRNRVEGYQRHGGEDRWKMIGAAGDQLLAVIYTERDDEESDELVIRIISARKATKRERKIYTTRR